MGAPKGNRFWEMRSSHGRKPIFETPEQLWDACAQYFEWVEDNPLYEEKVFHSNGKVTTHDSPKMRAMTIAGLCLFLDIGQKTWYDYKNKKDFSRVITQVEKVIYTQKFAGAAAEMLNPNIIARDLGLKDKAETAHTGPDGGPIISSSIEITAEMSQEEATELYRQMLDD